MRRSLIAPISPLVLFAVFVACTGDTPEVTASGSTAITATVTTSRHVFYKDNCPKPARRGQVACASHTITDAKGTPLASASPQGYGAPDLQAAYRLPVTEASGTVAIVDALDDPNAEADLAVYRAQYGMAPCSTTNGCFRKVNQNGVQGSYPAADAGWAEEISLDLDMASAGCPTCKILLVEASADDLASLAAAVREAVTLGAVVVSNSYASPESTIPPSDLVAYDQLYNYPGVLITASSGDSGYGAQFPATSDHVLAVGGTTLTRSSASRGWTETAWASGGSGCSESIPKPSYQHDTGCARRAAADVSAVADPNTAVAVYDSLSGGWIGVGGTSASSPLVAAIFASNDPGATPAFPYANPSLFFDVTSGSNGTCSPAYLCTAGAGYDGPTGIGTPDVALWHTCGSLGGNTCGAAGSSVCNGETLLGSTDCAECCYVPPAPTCGQAGGNTCGGAGSSVCNGYALLRSSDCAECCSTPPPPPTFGGPGDKPAPAEYWQAGTAVFGVFRPSTAQWFAAGDANAIGPFGASTDLPIPADYDGVGHAEFAVFRPSTAQWFVAGHAQVFATFGATTDLPVPADYDGVGHAEVAVFRPSTAQWFVGGHAQVFATFGATTDIPVPGDYDGVGHAELAVFRPSTAQWFVGGHAGVFATFGATTDIPVPADYDHVGHVQIAVFRPSTDQWFIAGH